MGDLINFSPCLKIIKDVIGDAPTYFTFDIAYHFNKYNRGFKKQIVFLGADHAGYTCRIKAAMQALCGDDVCLTVKLCNLVKFMENNVAMKMSKRDGAFVSIKDVLERIDKDSLRFLMLTKKLSKFMICLQ